MCSIHLPTGETFSVSRKWFSFCRVGRKRSCSFIISNILHLLGYSGVSNTMQLGRGIPTSPFLTVWSSPLPDVWLFASISTFLSVGSSKFSYQELQGFPWYNALFRGTRFILWSSLSRFWHLQRFIQRPFVTIPTEHRYCKLLGTWVWKVKRQKKVLQWSVDWKIWILTKGQHNEIKLHFISRQF